MSWKHVIAAAPLWIAVSPAFFLHWLPWWYVFPVYVGAVISESAAESIGRAGS